MYLQRSPSDQPSVPASRSGMNRLRGPFLCPKPVPCLTVKVTGAAPAEGAPSHSVVAKPRLPRLR